MNRVPAIAILALTAGAAGVGGLLLGGEPASSAPGVQPPMPVQEQNLDENGNIKVHELGTADVNVTNASRPMAPPEPVTRGGGTTAPTGTACDRTIELRGVATALSIFMDAVVRVSFSKNMPDGGVSVVAQFAGPAQGGNSRIVLGLARPIAFDSITSTGNGAFSVSWVGNE